MARIFYIHWNKEEALEAVRALRRAGHTVGYHWSSGEEAWKMLKSRPPDVLVVSLERLPSHGRRVAAVTRESKKLRDLPIVFVGGEQEKVKAARAEFPQARFSSRSALLRTLHGLL